MQNDCTQFFSEGFSTCGNPWSVSARRGGVSALGARPLSVGGRGRGSTGGPSHPLRCRSCLLRCRSPPLRCRSRLLRCWSPPLWCRSCLLRCRSPPLRCRSRQLRCRRRKPGLAPPLLPLPRRFCPLPRFLRPLRVRMLHMRLLPLHGPLYALRASHVSLNGLNGVNLDGQAIYGAFVLERQQPAADAGLVVVVPTSWQATEGLACLECYVAHRAPLLVGVRKHLPGIGLRDGHELILTEHLRMGGENGGQWRIGTWPPESQFCFWGVFFTPPLRQSIMIHTIMLQPVTHPHYAH